MSTQMDKLLAQQIKAQQKLHKAEMDDKKIKKQIADLQRNERTHRLCTRGAYLEKLLVEPELFTDEDVFAFLDYALNTVCENPAQFHPGNEARRSRRKAGCRSFHG